MAMINSTPSLINWLIQVILFTISWLSFPCIQAQNNDLHIKSYPDFIDSLNASGRDYLEFDHEKAKEIADTTLFQSSLISYPQGQAEAQEILGLYYGSKADYSKALLCYQQYLDIEEDLKDTTGIIWGNLRISGIHIAIRNRERARTYLELALNLAKRTNKSPDLGWVYLYYSKFYYSIKETEKSFSAVQKAYADGQKAGQLEVIGRSEKMIGDLLIEQKKYDQAIDYYNKALRTFRKADIYSEEGVLFTRIAHAFSEKDFLDSVLVYNQKALVSRLTLGNLTLISHSYVNIGKTYSRLNKLDFAERYIRKGLEVAIESKNNYVIQEAYHQLSILFEKKGNDQIALSFYKEYLKANELYQYEYTKSEIQAVELNNQLEESEKEKEILRQKLEIQTLLLESQQYSTIINHILIIVLILIIIGVFYISQRNKLNNHKLKAINRKLDQEIQEKRVTEHQLIDSEQRYRFVTDHTLDLIVMMDRNLNFLYLSASVQILFGFKQIPLSHFPSIEKLISREYHQELWNQNKEMIRTKKPVNLSQKCIRKDGSTFWAESLINPIFDPVTGKLKETITVVRDITERIGYEEFLEENAKQKEVLLREIHHRVKNNFAILISLINMQRFNQTTDHLPEIISELQGRIRTMSLVHELLYRSHDIDYIDFGKYLNQLVTIVFQAYRSTEVNIHTHYDPCILNVETALPLGLISNEILTNANKYAFQGTDQGELWIDLIYLKGESPNGEAFTHKLMIRDNGPGLPSSFDLSQPTSMGSQIISLLTTQIEGKIIYQSDHGTSFTLYFRDEPEP